MKVDVRVLIVEVYMLISPMNLPVTSPHALGVSLDVVLSCRFADGRVIQWRAKEDMDL